MVFIRIEGLGVRKAGWGSIRDMQTEFDARGSRRGDLADMGRTLRGSEQGGAAPVHEAGKGLGEDWRWSI